MSAIRYWVWDLRPDECAEWDWYEIESKDYPPRTHSEAAETYAISISGEPTLYHGDIDREMFRKLLAAIAAPTEADVRGLK